MPSTFTFLYLYNRRAPILIQIHTTTSQMTTSKLVCIMTLLTPQKHSDIDHNNSAQLQALEKKLPRLGNERLKRNYHDLTMTGIMSKAYVMYLFLAMEKSSKQMIAAAHSCV